MAQIHLIPGAKLMPMLKKLTKMGDEFHTAIHQFACSAMHHACKTGDTRPLTMFFNDVLTENYKTAFRLFLRRTYKEHPETECIGYKREEGFTIGGSDQKAREQLAKLIEAKLLNPDGVDYKRFYERNVIQEAILLDDKKFAQQLATLLKRARGEVGRVETKVSKDLINKLENLVTAAQAKVGVEKAATVKAH